MTDEEKAVYALLDVLDGSSVYDLRAQTGLPESHCEEIFKLRDRLLGKHYNGWIVHWENR
jgi:hypothetical protein